MKTLLTRLRTRPIPSLIAVVALVLATGFGVLAWMWNSNAETNEVVNTAGGYRIHVPAEWSVTQDDRTTNVTSPEGDTLISFGVGRTTGPLPVASTLFFQQVASNYRDVQVFPPDAKKVGPLNALVYGGLGTNKQDAKVRFLAITVESTPNNFGITVFTEANTDPATTLPVVNQIVDSFRKLPPS
jgi:hypothetical protein